MKLLIAALALGFVAASAPAAEAAACHHHLGACHRHFVYHHHYRHYAGVVVPPPGYPPPPPPYYEPFAQPLYAPLGWTIGEEYWGNRSVFKLLMQSIGDRPFND